MLNTVMRGYARPSVTSMSWGMLLIGVIPSCVANAAVVDMTAVTIARVVERACVRTRWRRDRVMAASITDSGSLESVERTRGVSSGENDLQFGISEFPYRADLADCPQVLAGGTKRARPGGTR